MTQNVCRERNRGLHWTLVCCLLPRSGRQADQRHTRAPQPYLRAFYVYSKRCYKKLSPRVNYPYLPADLVATGIIRFSSSTQGLSTEIRPSILNSLLNILCQSGQKRHFSLLTPKRPTCLRGDRFVRIPNRFRNISSRMQKIAAP